MKKIEFLTVGDKVYKVIDGTYYHQDTPDMLIDVLENIRKEKIRIKINYGDRATGKSWGETHDISGTIGRSMGPVKCPILLHNSRSTGGGIILTQCILEIKTSKGNKLLYRWTT
jgi:hypothetical protein